jgi:hypothetical protein
MSNYPKYLYFPDWSADKDNAFTNLFYIPNAEGVKVVTEDAGAKLIYHDNSNCNCMPELVFEFPTEDAAKKLFFLLTGQELKKDIPNVQVLSLAWVNGEYFYGPDDEEWTEYDILNVVENNKNYNLVNK